MIVVDASALVLALTDASPKGDAARRGLTVGDVHAPHLLEIEVLQVLRRLVRVGELASERAEAATADMRRARIQLHRHGPLLVRAWALRDNLSAYDAAYVALAETLECPLLTADARMARAPDHGATVQLIA